MSPRCFALAFALLAGIAVSSSKNQLRASAKAKSKMQARTKLPWAGMDADGGEEYEFGNQRSFESDPKLFDMDSYKHPDATDDADVAEDDPYSEDELNSGDDTV